MNMDERIKRINELYHKSQDVGLTSEEKAEQAKLRQEYIASIRGSIRAQLNNIDIKEKDGTITNLGEKAAKKREDEFNADTAKGKKSLLRKKYSDIRDQLSLGQREEASKIICGRITSYREYKRADSVLVYYPYRSEVDVLPLFEKALNDGKKVYFPKCELIDGTNSMKFYRVTSADQFESGYKGISEPAADKYNLECEIDSADLMIVPGVAFDKKGYRIGYGKGFYDKYLSTKMPKHTIGACFAAQICEEGIPSEDNDIKLEVVVTEKDEFGDFT